MIILVILRGVCACVCLDDQMFILNFSLSWLMDKLTIENRDEITGKYNNLLYEVVGSERYTIF